MFSYVFFSPSFIYTVYIYLCHAVLFSVTLHFHSIISLNRSIHPSLVYAVRKVRSHFTNERYEWYIMSSILMTFTRPMIAAISGILESLIFETMHGWTYNVMMEHWYTVLGNGDWWKFMYYLLMMGSDTAVGLKNGKIYHMREASHLFICRRCQDKRQYHRKPNKE